LGRKKQNWLCSERWLTLRKYQGMAEPQASRL
jgi:hypothetical protein